MATEKKGIMQEFKDFLLRGNLVDLAVAVVIGIAFGAVINALVKDIITPLIAAIFGKPDFGNLHFRIHKSIFLYGDFINALIYFLSVAAAVFFFVVKPVNYMLTQRRRGAEPTDEASLSDEALLLTEIRDLLRERRSV